MSIEKQAHKLKEEKKKLPHPCVDAAQWQGPALAPASAIFMCSRTGLLECLKGLAILNRLLWLL